MDIIRYIVNKSSVITSNVGGGSTSLVLYILNYLLTRYNVLYYDTGNNLDREYIKKFYPNVYENCFIIQGSKETFMNYISELGMDLDYIDYVVIDCADMIGKQQLQHLKMLFDMYDIKMIVTSQLRENPNTGKPYSTVEEWNKQLSEKIFDLSIWIRKANQPNDSVHMRYVDIFPYFRVGNRYDKRYLFRFDKKRGNII